MFSRSFSKHHAINNASPLRFPQKLWKLANECQSGAVSWSPHGKSILLRYSLFKEEFMSSKSDFFKTDNISSFVRQLNLYGFKKVYDHTQKHVYKANSDLHEFSNVHFQRDRYDLLDKVTRKSGILKDKNDFLLENQHSIQEDWDFLENIKEESATSFDEENNISNGHDEEFESFAKPMMLPKVALTSSIKDQESLLLKTLEPPKTNTVLAEPIKKKRGRKPGSKLTKHVKCISIPKSVKYFIPTLRAPELSSKLIHFEDEDDSIFLRHTSRDVMFSSTLPFQETAEYLELKDTYHRLYQPKVRLRYSSLPLSIPYQNYNFTSNRGRLYNLRI